MNFFRKWFSREKIIPEVSPEEDYLFVKGLSRTESAQVDEVELDLESEHYLFFLTFQTIRIQLEHELRTIPYWTLKIQTLDPPEVLYHRSDAWSPVRQSFCQTTDFLLKTYGIDEIIRQAQNAAEQKQEAEKQRIRNLKNQYIVKAKKDSFEDELQ